MVYSVGQRNLKEDLHNKPMKYDDRLTIFLPFFLCALILTPLGLFSSNIDPFEHSSFFSLTTIDAGDDQGYYAYLRSVFFDGDVDFLNERNYAYFYHLTRTNYSLNLWPCGPALLWAPFFLIGEVVEKLLVFVGVAEKTYGYGWSHLVTTGLGTIFYVFCGFLLLYKTLSLLFTRKAALWSCWTLFLSSPLPYFAFVRSRMGHFAEFFTLSLILYIWFRRPSSENSIPWGFCLGCVLALVGMSRYTNMAIGVFPIAIFFVIAWFIPKKKEPLAIFSKTCGAILLAFAATISIQILIWVILFGSYYPDDPHLDKFKMLAIPLTFSLLWERLISVLASPYFGLFWCFQPWLIGYVSLFFIQLKKIKLLPLFEISYPEEVEANVFKWLAIALAFWSFYLTLTWTLAEFSSYGRRLLIASIPFVAFGLASLYDRLKSQLWKIFFSICCFSFVLINLIQTIQFRWLIDYADLNYSLESFKKIPEMFSAPGGMFSTSLAKLLYLKSISVNSLSDFFFIIIFPLLVFLFMWLAWLFCGFRKEGEQTSPVYRSWVPIGLMILIFLSTIFLNQNRRTFAEKEINNRIQFTSLMRNFPEFVFDKNSSLNEQDALTAIGLKPDSSRAFFILGYIYTEQGNIAKGIRLLEKSIELDKLNHSAYWAMGIALKKSGSSEYLEYMQQALKLQPHRNYRLVYLFEVAADHFQNQRFSESIQVLEKVIWLAPNWADAHKNLAINFYYSDSLLKAKKHAELAKGFGADMSKLLTVLESSS